MALDHVSFSVEEGTILGFLGPNGAGKSTTMNIITGYLSASEGEAVSYTHLIQFRRFSQGKEQSDHI